MRAGQTTNLYGEYGKYFRVRLEDGRDGYVSRNYTRRIPDGLAVTSTDDVDSETLRIHFLNTGAGTCTVVECPGENAPPMIVDCGSFGPSSRTDDDLDEAEAKAAVRAILSRHSVKPNVVLSHGDKDHYAYIPMILDGIDVATVWQGDRSSEYGSGAFPSWLAAQKARGAKVNQNLAKHFHNDGYALGDELPCGKADVYVLTANTGTSKNGRSLVLDIEYGDFAAIFTADAERDTEARAISNFDGAVQATVVSGSHHGAESHGSNSAAWAQATEPAVLIYSSGTLYGHPRCNAAARFHPHLATTSDHDMHCNYSSKTYAQRKKYSTTKAEYSTAVSGTITIETDGSSPLTLKCQRGDGCNVTIDY